MCWHTPNLLIGLALRDHPKLAGRPLALLDASEIVCALSREARISNVAVGMAKHQAQRRCPDLVMQPLDMAQRQQEQSALMGALAEWGLPVEERGWGSAYIDMRPVANDWNELRPLCIDLAQKIHRRWDKAPVLVPKIGWDSCKFVAFAAASAAPQGKMKPISKQDEQPFLRQQPVHLLPLTPLSLQYLDWLDIRTVGAYGELPAAAVRQRFGEAGKVAHRLAQGKDNRPVCPNVHALPAPVEVDFESPVETVDFAVEHALAALRSRFREMGSQAKGCRHLRIELRFLDHSKRIADCAFIEAVNPISFPEQGFRLRESVFNGIRSVTWPSALVELRLTLLSAAEVTAEQLTLFPELCLDDDDSPTASDIVAAAERLAFARTFIGRYGSRAFSRIESVDDEHPVVERRARLTSIAGDV